jgi:hypothetical protein
MTQHDWDLIGYGVWAIIIWMTLKQFLETRKPVKGNGLRLLFGDILMVLPLPWIISLWIRRGEMDQIGYVFLYGILLAIPYILTSNYAVNRDGKIQFKLNYLFYLFLFGFPYVRYEIRTYVFQHHPILFPNHFPDIELMLSYYIAVLIVYTFVWRLWLYYRFRTVQAKAQSQSTLNA